MLRKYFWVVNPSLSLKTHHLHITDFVRGSVGAITGSKSHGTFHIYGYNNVYVYYELAKGWRNELALT